MWCGVLRSTQQPEFAALCWRVPRVPFPVLRPQRDTLAAVQRLQAAGADRLVLDLRDNRGGLVTEGIEVRAVVVSVVYQLGGSVGLLCGARHAVGTTTQPGRPFCLPLSSCLPYVLHRWPACSWIAAHWWCAQRGGWWPRRHPSPHLAPQPRQVGDTGLPVGLQGTDLAMLFVRSNNRLP